MKRIGAVLGALLALVGPITARAAGEREMGRRFLLEARAALPLIDDPAVVGVVHRLGGRLVEALGPQEFDYEFFVVRHPSLNAFAVPGGYVFVFSGLLARAESEDELVGVLGHEVAHVHAHHVVRQQTAGQVWTAAGLLGVLLTAVNPVLGVGAMAAAQTAQLKFSREFEQEADFLGVRIATEAGFDPLSLGGFFEHLIAESRLNPTGLPPYMLSHPVSEDRVSSVESTVRAQKLRTPPGRQTSSLDLREAQAIVRALDQPADVVVASYEKRLQDQPTSAEAKYLLGRVHQTIGKLEAARSELESVVNAPEIGVRVHRALGDLYLTLGDSARAERHIRQYLSVDGADGVARRQLGRALQAQNDMAGATEQYRRAVALVPNDAESHRLYGLALGRSGDEREGLYNLAVGARLGGDLAQALRHFERVKELTPEDGPRRRELDDAIDDLVPLVRRSEREPARR